MTKVPGSRRGIALAVALLALVAMAAVPSVMLAVAWSRGKTERDRADAARAVELAEAGAAHAIGLVQTTLKTVTFTQLLQGQNSATDTGTDSTNWDDGLLIKWTNLTDVNNIPIRGRLFSGGRYYVRIVDDVETDNNLRVDTNNRIIIRCRGETFDRWGNTETSATINLVWTRVDPVPFAVATAGNLDIDQLKSVGKCREVYVGGLLYIGANNDNPDVNTDGTRMSWRLTQNPKQGSATPTGTVAIAAATSIPYVSKPTDGCPSNALRPASPDVPASLTIPSNLMKGKNLEASFSNLVSGRVYCVIGGNAILTGTNSGATPKHTIIADGHISIINNSPDAKQSLTFTPAATDATALHAGGDLKIYGRVYIAGDGSVYCGSQFDVQGLDLNGGQLVCADRQDPPSTIVGSTTVTVREMCKVQGKDVPCDKEYQVSTSFADAPGTGGSTPGLSVMRAANNQSMLNSVNFKCKARWARPGWELSRVAWFPTFGT